MNSPVPVTVVVPAFNAGPYLDVTLQSLHASHPRPDALRAGYEAIGLAGVGLSQGPPNLIATLQTPRGLVTLESKGV